MWHQEPGHFQMDHNLTTGSVVGLEISHMYENVCQLANLENVVLEEIN